MAIRSLRYTLRNVKVGKKPTQEKLKLKSNPPSTNDGNPLLHPLPHRTYLRLQRNVTGFRRQPFRGIKWKTVKGLRNSLFNSAYLHLLQRPGLRSHYKSIVRKTTPSLFQNFLVCIIVELRKLINEPRYLFVLDL